MAQPIPSPATATSHNLFFLWVVLVGIVVIVGIVMGPNSPYFWLWWEGGALATATCYTVVFYWRLFRLNDDTGVRIYKGIGDLVGLVPLLCAGAVLCLAMATTITFLTSLGIETSITSWLLSLIGSACDKNILPVVFLFASGLFFCSIDLMFASGHCNEEIQREFRQGLLFNAVPVALAFLMLLLFVCRFDGNAWDVQLKSFIGGAVAFEMLLSNTMFAILFWKPRKI